MASKNLSYSKLRGKILEVCKTQYNFADKLGISRTSVNEKLNGKSDWSMSQVRKACEILEIKKSEIPSYFFE